jgi:hypothetical protein
MQKGNQIITDMEIKKISNASVNEASLVGKNTVGYLIFFNKKGSFWTLFRKKIN